MGELKRWEDEASMLLHVFGFLFSFKIACHVAVSDATGDADVSFIGRELFY